MLTKGKNKSDVAFVLARAFEAVYPNLSGRTIYKCLANPKTFARKDILSNLELELPETQENVVSLIEATIKVESDSSEYIGKFVICSIKYTGLLDTLVEGARRSQKKLEAREISNIIKLCGPLKSNFWRSTITERFPDCLKLLKESISTHSNVDFTSNKQ